MMKAKLECPICGEPTRVYMGNARKDRLCGKHADLLKTGEIYVKDDNLFIDSKSNIILNKDYKYTELPTRVLIIALSAMKKPMDTLFVKIVSKNSKKKNC
jgi:hypothetical protein